MGMRLLFVIAALGLAVSCCAQQKADQVRLLQDVRAERRNYEIGDLIQFEYAIRNAGTAPVTYSFSSSKQFDLWVMQGSNEVFRLSKGKMYATVITNLTLQPGETKSYNAVWDQKDQSGKQVGPGTYTVYAQLTPSGSKPLWVSARLRIGGSAALIPTTVGAAISNFNQLEGKSVSITATYKGWSPNPTDPNTKDGPPETRSDWAICDDTGCMYVTGRANLDPVNDSGSKITVIGKLRKTSKGQVFMALENAAPGRQMGKQ